MRPLFTIVTVTYNAQETIKKTLSSVSRQTCRLYEHLIVDGASSDHTLQIIRDFDNQDRLVLISEPDKGIYDAMNKGIANAQGDYLIFLNSGDKFHSPDTLQHIADAIALHDNPGIVYGQTDIVDSEGRYLGPRHLIAPENLTIDSFKHGMVVCHQAFVVLRRIAMFYNTKYKFSADYEWCILALQHSRKNVYLPETLIDYLSEGMTTRNHKASLQERFKIMSTYYGFFPTICRHISFAMRYMRRRKTAVNSQ